MKRLLGWLERLEGLVAVCAYVLVAALLIAEIVARELIGMPILGAREIAVLAAAVAGLLGMSLATGAGVHLRPAAFETLFPARYDRSLDRISDAVAALVYVAFAIAAFRFIGETRAAGDRAAILMFPLWPVQVVLPAAFLSSALRHLVSAVDPRLRPLRGSHPVTRPAER